MGDYNINQVMHKGRKQKLKTIYSKHNFQQMIKGPTRLTKVSKTLIDLVFTNRIEGVTKTYNLITGLSDHNMVLIVRKRTKKLLKSWCNGKPEFVGIPKNKTTQFENDLRNISWDGAI